MWSFGLPVAASRTGAWRTSPGRLPSGSDSPAARRGPGAATGTFLLVVDPNYDGLGNFFASTWTTLMLVKHVLVVGLVAMGLYVDRLIRRGGGETSENVRESARRRLGLSVR